MKGVRENGLLCACGGYAPCALLRKESGFCGKAALLRKEYQDCRLVQACYDAVFLPSCTATAAFPAIPCRCGWVLWPVSVREVSVTRVCTVMCFRNGSKSRNSLPLWLGAVAGVGPRGVCYAGVYGDVFPQRQQIPHFTAIVGCSGIGYSGIPASGHV